MDNKELKIKAELANGGKPRALSEKYGVHYTTVIGYRKQMQEEAEKRKASKLASVDPVAVQVVVDNIPDDADIPKVDFQPVIEGAKGLGSLESNFQEATKKLLERGMELMDDEKLTPTGWKTLASGIGELYSNIYMNKGTNVQVNNVTNTVSGDGMSMFGGKKPR